ncbi:MAG: glycosyltransferase family 4 protein [Alphaproteobacteria bacterium]|nr:glycosyltransferase family 4 protein [Alphaproteobacteria bacterium]MBU0886735.1 glycosyltransferase family 4 protein [Alphaproteobacteria bacterium]MBU1812652.1 glycosyltransferase family 4 protein [Alphaproteobacteria bacterium]
MTERARHNAAILYRPDAISDRPMGRQVAEEGFLRGYARHAVADSLYCCAASPEDAGRFAAIAATAGGPHREVRWAPMDSPTAIAEAGCLFLSGPNLRPAAFLRRGFNQRAYSLCGVTHTLASAAAMDAIGDLLLAPIQPWDALICTSRAGRDAVERQLQAVAAYLGDRMGASPPTLPELRTIPLGIDCAAYGRDEAQRAAWRGRLGIGPEDVVALFVGRLSAHAKANPDPMYMALERAAQRTSRKLHLIQAGWFHNAGLERGFRSAAAQLAPSVGVHIVSPLEEEAHRQIWSAADFFLSPSDNIQETFGLTPLEAMAAGLPVVVSDWDGYRDTVRDGIDGFRIPTLTPMPGGGGDLAARHALGMDRYDLYIGKASLFTAFDIDSCAEACLKLADDAELRRKMGESGRARARAHFDWSAIVPAYQALWAELAERRSRAVEAVPPAPDRPADPWRLDPFLQFGAYPSRTLTANSLVRLAPEGLWELEAAYASPHIGYARTSLPTVEEARVLCRHLAEIQECRAVDLVRHLPVERQPVAFRGLAWLAKYGVVTIHTGEA